MGYKDTPYGAARVAIQSAREQLVGTAEGMQMRLGLMLRLYPQHTTKHYTTTY
jgi:hypothetical protein